MKTFKQFLESFDWAALKRSAPDLTLQKLVKMNPRLSDSIKAIKFKGFDEEKKELIFRGLVGTTYAGAHSLVELRFKSGGDTIRFVSQTPIKDLPMTYIDGLRELERE
jgi:hypothetical protein